MRGLLICKHFYPPTGGRFVVTYGDSSVLECNRSVVELVETTTPLFIVVSTGSTTEEGG